MIILDCIISILSGNKMAVKKKKSKKNAKPAGEGLIDLDETEKEMDNLIG